MPSGALALFLLLSSQSLAQQPLEHEARGAEGEELLVPTVFEGFVLAPDGAPAEGAVVLSSAGGQAVTDHAGNFRLEVGVPLEAESVQLTALGRGGQSLVASSTVSLSGASALVRTGPLLLSSTTCSPSWLPTFGSLPGTSGIISTFLVHDDGSGPALYVGGSFSEAGSVAANNIAKWNGSSWSPMGAGMNDGVEAFAVFDDGNGPALYAAGRFTTADGLQAKQVAKWDGTNWSALSSGMNNGAVVFALCVFDDGSGPALYAGGTFHHADGLFRSYIARWDGSSWLAVGSGMNNTVFSLAVFDDGGGPALYAGGHFTTAGGVAANRIAKWNGSSWSALGSGTNSTIVALAAYDDGGGPALYAGGDFTTAGGVAANRIAKWNGSSWSPLGAGLDSRVQALAVIDDGGGPALYAGGDFTTAGDVVANHIARWNGSSWSTLGSGTHLPEHTWVHVGALASFNDAGGPALYVGGLFWEAGSVAAYNIAKWDGSSWSSLDVGLNREVRALTVFDDGGGPTLYAGGDFASAGGVARNRIASWNGSSWSTVGSGLNLAVRALSVFDDGGGPALYAGGHFTTAGGVAANSIAKWDGASWSPLGAGLDGWVEALAVFDDGGGPALYAAGSFTAAGGLPASRIARWNGTSWSALGAGLDGEVRALASFDGGSGPELIAAGTFTQAGGAPASRIARWNGASWTDLGRAFNPNFVSALAVFDDGNGPALFAGGDFFLSTGGVITENIARWDGTSWTNVGNGTNGSVSALSAFDDGGGPALYVGGEFDSPGRLIARWNGASWAGLGNGLDGPLARRAVRALTVYDDGGGPALYAGGLFHESDTGDSFLAKWGQRPQPVVSCPDVVYAKDIGGPGEFVTFAVTASDCWTPAPTVVCIPPSGSFFPRGRTLVTCTATNAFGNQTTRQFPVVVQTKATIPGSPPQSSR